MNEIDNCCLRTGSESPSTWCARKCRLYKEARRKADQFYPRSYPGTGFGNLSNRLPETPSLGEIRAEAAKIIASEENVSDSQGGPDIAVPEPVRKLKEQGFKLGEIDRTKSKPEDRNII